MDDLFTKITVFEQELAEEEITFLSKLEKLNYQMEMMSLEIRQLLFLKENYQSLLSRPEPTSFGTQEHGVYTTISEPNFSRRLPTHRHQSLDSNRLYRSYASHELYNSKRNEGVTDIEKKVVPNLNIVKEVWFEGSSNENFQSLVDKPLVLSPFEFKNNEDELKQTSIQNQESVKKKTEIIENVENSHPSDSSKPDKPLAVNSIQQAESFIVDESSLNEKFTEPELEELPRGDSLREEFERTKALLNEMSKEILSSAKLKQTSEDLPIPETNMANKEVGRQSSNEISSVDVKNDSSILELPDPHHSKEEEVESSNKIFDENLNALKSPNPETILEVGANSHKVILSENSDSNVESEMPISSYEAYRNMVAGNAFPQQKVQVIVDSESEDDVEKAMMMAVEKEKENPLQNSLKVPSVVAEKPPKETKEATQKQETIISPEKKAEPKKTFRSNTTNPLKQKFSKATRIALGLDSDYEEIQSEKKKSGQEDSDEFDFYG